MRNQRVKSDGRKNFCFCFCFGLVWFCSDYIEGYAEVQCVIILVSIATFNLLFLNFDTSVVGVVLFCGMVCLVCVLWGWWMGYIAGYMLKNNRLITCIHLVQRGRYAKDS